MGVRWEREGEWDQREWDERAVAMKVRRRRLDVSEWNERGMSAYESYNERVEMAKRARSA